ncbi:hypothetical protein GTP46_05875 [Duganella sp. FT135W]|uniref:Uncharacterized protein n=1 Tax=Duganella flavida TaxID=2692175 RepID=A0A6L8K7G7_9BURK|nr:hypothetical protein [Duganella flavida]MYM22168.1 hypothetical protein [Duganella flavida]
MDKQLAQIAAAAFVDATEGRWPLPKIDILDDGTFVLFSVELPFFEPLGQNHPTCKVVTKLLDELIPSHPTQPFGSWIIAFISYETVVDAI